MTLFSVFAVPIFFLFIVVSFLTENIKHKEIFVHYLKGVGIFILSLIVYLIFRKLLQLNYSTLGIYLYFFINDNLFFSVMGLSGYIILYGFTECWHIEERLPELLVFFSGFFTFLGLTDMILHFGWYDIYLLFYLPVIRIILILGISMIVSKVITIHGYLKYFALAGGIVLPAATTLISFFYTLNYVWIALLLTVVLFSGVSIIFYSVNRRIL